MMTEQYDDREGRRVWFSRDEVDAVIEVVDRVQKVVFRLAAECELRTHETVELTADHVVDGGEAGKMLVVSAGDGEKIRRRRFPTHSLTPSTPWRASAKSTRFSTTPKPPQGRGAQRRPHERSSRGGTERGHGRRAKRGANEMQSRVFPGRRAAEGFLSTGVSARLGAVPESPTPVQRWRRQHFP